MKLLANEFAPRVHNSGHWTSDACLTGQFEQHIRAVCGWPLGDPARHSDGEMINLLGSDAHDWEKHLSEGAKLHLYGKRKAVDGRKMGHVTLLRPRR
jgi:5-(carboxyamino)imidazole ribonucleotide synthase